MAGFIFKFCKSNAVDVEAIFSELQLAATKGWSSMFGRGGSVELLLNILPSDWCLSKPGRVKDSPFCSSCPFLLFLTGGIGDGVAKQDAITIPMCPSTPC